MTDFGLDDDIIREDIRIKTLRWHGLLSKTVVWTGYPSNSGLNCIVKDGMGDDLGGSPIKSSVKKHE